MAAAGRLGTGSRLRDWKGSGFGNSSRNGLSGPGIAQLDLTLDKKFQITETTNVEFRSEIYNTLNHANFSNPTAAGDPERAGRYGT